MQAQIENRIATGQTTAEKVEGCRKNLDLELDEFCKFQELKSLAVVEGKLTVEEGQQVYNLLGKQPGHFNAQPIAVKFALTNLYQELLNARIQAARS